MWVLWLALASLFALLAVWPFLGYPLTLEWLARRRARPIRRSERPEDWPRAVDLVFCAYNEAGGIARKIENCLAIDPAGRALKIHVYSDGSNDGTEHAARPYADRIDLVVSSERTGKSVGMNRLLERCSGDIVVFTDANVELPPDCLRQLLPLFVDPQVGCVIGHLVYRNPDGGTTAEISSLYWRLEERIKALEARIGSTMGADGSIFAIRRRLFRPVPADIIDDMFTSLSILCDGHRIARADGLVAYEASAGDRGDEVRRKIRIACRSFNCHRLLWPRLRRLPPLDRYMYVCHKLLRWFTFVWLMLAALFYLLFALTSPAPALWLGLPLAAIAAFAIAWAARLRVAQQLVDVLLAFVATARGVLESLQGRRYQTWQPPASSR